MTIDETKDELYRLLSDCVNNSYPIRNNTQKGRYRNAVKMAIASLEAWEKVKAEIEDYMKRKWEQLSDSDKVIVTGVTTIDDWKFHMAESTLDIIDRHLQEISETETWSGFHGQQIIAPKGTFDKIYNAPDEEDDDI